MSENKKVKKYRKPFPWTETILIAIMAALVIGSGAFFVSNIRHDDYIVETNAFFAPFEFYDNREIVGVDIEIINRVAAKMNKSIGIKNVEFDVIIDNVEAGRIADAGAAGLTITPARLEKVNFSIPYYTSSQYVIYADTNPPAMTDHYTTWAALAGHTLGSQTGSTGYLFTAEEIDTGSLKDTATTLKGLGSHQLAADAISAHIVDYVIADELAASFIVMKNPALSSVPLYYNGATPAEDTPVEESYAIAVNKQRPELLAAFNEVLTEMLTPDPKGITEIHRLVNEYMTRYEATTEAANV